MTRSKAQKQTAPTRARTGWLNASGVIVLLLILLYAAFSLFLIFNLIVHLTHSGTGWPIMVHFAGPVSSDAAGLPDNITPMVSEVQISEATLTQTLWWSLKQASAMTLSFAVLLPLGRALRDAGALRLFSGGNDRRIRRIGFTLLFGGLGYAAIEMITDWMVVRSALGDQAPGIFFTPSMIFLAGIGVLALNEIIKHGVALRTELDEVV